MEWELELESLSKVRESASPSEKATGLVTSATFESPCDLHCFQQYICRDLLFPSVMLESVFNQINNWS